MRQPPRPAGPDGQPRRIGVEMEFGGLSVEAAVRVVQQTFGGRTSFRDPHRAVVHDTVHGDFTVALDMRVVHPPEGPPVEAGGDVAWRMENEIRARAGDVASAWVPCEIAAPPVPLESLPDLDRLTANLRHAGARGTDDGLLFAFGLQLNPEAPALDAATLLAHLRAYVLLSGWLRREIDVDMKRRMLVFVDPFPRAYARHILTPGYAPDLATLMDDYLAANPTRNRELDMLPLFAWLDPARVQRVVADPRIRPRPAFHYRLPDSRFSHPHWTVAEEWDRWVTVEALAADPERLAGMAAAYREHYDGLVLRDTWPEKAAAWLA